jgi:hypothetical protein
MGQAWDKHGTKIENERRKEALAQPYNPATGLGCYGKRNRLDIAELSNPLFIPVEMEAEPIVKRLRKAKGSLTALWKKQKIDVSESEFVISFLRLFSDLRIKYDFEFFSVSCIKIEDGETHTMVPFRLKRGQRRALERLEKRLRNNEPIRLIVPKARQLGLSTLFQIYMLYIQLVHRSNWHSVVCAHLKDKAKNVRSMMERAVAELPLVNGSKISLAGFSNSVDTKQLTHRMCQITIGSAENPDSVRSQNPTMVHLTEVAFFPDTEKKAIKDLIASMVSPIRDEPFTLVIMESSPNGVGDFFYKEYQKAKKGESAYDALFLAWFWDDTYRRDFDGSFYNHSGKLQKGDVDDFIESMTDYEREIFTDNEACTLEGLNWYRRKNAEMTSDELMRQEFASNDIEAFQDSGMPVFRASLLNELLINCCEPKMIGSLTSDVLPTEARYRDTDKQKILTGIEFVPDHEAMTALRSSDRRLIDRRTRNLLRVWELPDKEADVSDRYVVTFDPNKGISEKADFGAITVLDRFPLTYGGVPEVVAEWHGRIDKDIEIWMAAQIAKFYNDALLVVECNTYDQDAKKEDYSDYIFETLADYYDNLYTHEAGADKIREGKAVRYGFHTNRATKTSLVTEYGRIIREKGYVERSDMAVEEALMYEKAQDGSWAARQGYHDDLLMSRMIALYVSYNKMSLPTIIEKPNLTSYTRPIQVI